MSDGGGSSVIAHLNGDESGIALGGTENTDRREAICMSGKASWHDINLRLI